MSHEPCRHPATRPPCFGNIRNGAPYLWPRNRQEPYGNMMGARCTVLQMDPKRTAKSQATLNGMQLPKAWSKTHTPPFPLEEAHLQLQLTSSAGQPLRPWRQARHMDKYAYFSRPRTHVCIYSSATPKAKKEGDSF